MLTVTLLMLLAYFDLLMASVGTESTAFSSLVLDASGFDGGGEFHLFELSLIYFAADWLFLVLDASLVLYCDLSCNPAS